MEYIQRRVKKYLIKEELNENIENREEENIEEPERIILDNRVSVIIGESGRGKSSLLKNLRKERKDTIYMKVSDINEEIETLNNDEKIYLLDSIDEAFQETSSGIKSKQLNRAIDIILKLNKNNRIIITSRHYTDLKCESITYELLQLTKDEINYLLKNKKKSEKEFWTFIEKSGLEEHLGNIVILDKIIEEYDKYTENTTKSDIYKDLCKEFLKIVTSNDNNFKGENIETLLDELSILATTKKFNRDFPYSSFKLKGKEIDKSKKEKLEKTPFFIEHKMKFSFVHQSIEEFLVAYFFHKKLEYKEIDFENLKFIFFNLNFLKKELEETLEFLMELESDEFKEFIMENKCLNLIKLQNLEDKFQLKILEKTIKLLQEEPYYLWGQWDVLDKAKINIDLEVETAFKNIEDYNKITNETFTYLMVLLKNNYNIKLMEYIIIILKSRIKKYVNLDKILGGVFIEKIDFIKKIDNSLRKENIQLESDFYFLPKFIILLYPIIKKEIIFYLNCIKARELRKIKEEFEIDDLIYFCKEITKEKNYENIEKVRIMMEVILKRKDFSIYKNKILDVVEKNIVDNYYIKNDILNLLSTKLNESERIKFLKKYFNSGKFKFLCVLKKEDIFNEEIENILAEYELEKNISLYCIVDEYFSNEEFHLKLIKNNNYLIEFENRKRNELEENKESEDILENMTEETLYNLMERYNNKKFGDRLIEKYDNKNCNILIELIYEMFNFYGEEDIYSILIERIPSKIDLINKEMIKYFIYYKKEESEFLIRPALYYIKSLSVVELENVIKIEYLEKLIKGILISNSRNSNNDELIKFLFSEKNKKKSFEIIKKIFNDNDIKFIKTENFIQDCFYKFSVNEKSEFIEILDNNCLSLNLNPIEENDILKIILKNKDKSDFLDIKLKEKEKENNLNYNFVELYIKYRGINNFLEKINFNKDIKKFEEITMMLYQITNLKEYLNEMQEKSYEKILKFYDENFVYDIRNKKNSIMNEKDYLYDFIFYKVLNSLTKNGNKNMIKNLLSLKFNNQQISNYVKFSYKKKLESEILKDEVSDIIEKSKFNPKYYKFDYDKFLNNLVIIIEHITEMRALIINKNFSEDEITDLICFGLEMKGYASYVQRRGGDSESKVSSGERDVVIKNGERIVTILEALILEYVDSNNIKIHYEKLNRNYDTIGNTKNYFLCYYKGKNFKKFYDKYKVKCHELFVSKYLELSIEGENKENIKIIKTKLEEKEIFHIIINLKC